MDINVKLNKNFTTQLNKLKEKYGEEFEKINGVADSQLNLTDFIDNFIDKDTVADVSVDSSSNVSKKSMATLIREQAKPQQNLLALNKLYYEMQKKYGFKEANKWLELQWNKALYMHDLCTSTFLSYCFAYDLKDLAEKGLFFIENHGNCPPKHLDSFLAFCREFINFNSNLTSGAVGLPNLIPYMYYFWDRDIKQGYYIKNPEFYAKQNIEHFLFSINQPLVRDGIQSCFSNTSIFDHAYLTALFGGSVFPDGAPMIDEIENIMDFQKLFLEEMSRIRSKNMMTFPVNTISLLRKDGKFVDEEFAKYAIAHNMKWSDSNIFIDDSVNSLSNCCRLKSNIQDLGFFNSIGGTALKVGSVKVSTINLARIALETNSEQEYLARLKEVCESNLKALDVQRHIIKRNVEKGLLPNYSYGIIDFEHLYSTCGLSGIFETMKTFGYTYQDELGNTFYSKEADDFGQRIFNTIQATIDIFKLDKDYMINKEYIPGETANIKFKQADELLYPDKVVKDLPLYGNQFIPLGIKTTIQERLRIASKYDAYCNGGSICHINIDAPFNSFESAWKMVNYIADTGLTYFAFNTKISACESNHGFYGDVCPECGKPKTSEYTRIAGFYTPIKTWSKERKEEFKMREWHHLEDNDGKAAT